MPSVEIKAAPPARPPVDPGLVDLGGRARLGEGPLWSVRERILYWLDIAAPAVRVFDPASRAHRALVLPESAGALVERRAGGLMLAARHGFATFDPASGAFAALATPEAGRDENRFNDGKCDRRGRFWAGSMHRTGAAPTGALYRLDADRQATRQVEGVTISNGLGWSLDDRIMYYADTATGRIDAFDYDLASGAIANRRPFVCVPAADGQPDGLCVDSEGFVWCALWGGWRVVRYAPDGRVDRVVGLPVPQPTSCAFGGPNLDVLYITSMREEMGPAELAAAPTSGNLFQLVPGVRGLAETPYAG